MNRIIIKTKEAVKQYNIRKRKETNYKYSTTKWISNNQAEQLAIMKALEAVGSIHTADINIRTATIFTDSKITLDSLHDASNDA